MGAYDQRPVEARNDVLVYSTEPLDEGIEITGRVTVELYVDFTAPTTDFTAKLVDVFPDGRAINLCQSVMRVEKSRKESPQLITFGVGATSNFFDKAHRIRLEVSSSNFPMYERNLNTTKPAGPLSAQLSTQRVFHRSSSPSSLLLPIVEPAL
jgi:putative CocE/NonD family hydrolase